MIVPSIDLQGGQTVQLVGGETPAIEAGDPRPLAERFSRVGEIAVIDLDAALGQGDHAEMIRDLCTRHRCRVGGGIRDVETARAWLDAGAAKIILGTAATPEILSQLPRDRVIAALDARDGEVVVRGWTERTGASIEERMAALRPHVGGFLITFVEREGRMQGTAWDRIEPLVKAAGDARITFAGGITTAEEIGRLDALGADAQVGMALYTGKLDLAEAFTAPLRSDREDGLWATVVVDEADRALGLCWSDLESVRTSLEEGIGAYHSRTRGLWRKGATSGAVQRLRRIDVDCDRDALRFQVTQAGPGFCHEATTSCWGDLHGIPGLYSRLKSRAEAAPEGSYTHRLLHDGALLESKLREEIDELIEANTPEHTAEEAADVLYFTLVRLVAAGVSLDKVQSALDRRRLKVSRRPGNAKPERSR